MTIAEAVGATSPTHHRLTEMFEGTGQIQQLVIARAIPGLQIE